MTLYEICQVPDILLNALSYVATRECEPLTRLPDGVLEGGSSSRARYIQSEWHYLFKISSQWATSWRFSLSSCRAAGTREYTRDSSAADMAEHDQVWLQPRRDATRDYPKPPTRLPIACKCDHICIALTHTAGDALKRMPGY